jgi:ferritin-like metal-binding protein YciE
LIFEIFGKKAVAKKCGTIDGLLKEAVEIMESSEEGAMCDARIISMMQKVAHYEIASYGILWQFAKTLGMTDVVELIHMTLNEEKAVMKRLMNVADDAISIVVCHEDDEGLVEAYGMWL